MDLEQNIASRLRGLNNNDVKLMKMIRHYTLRKTRNLSL